MTQIRKISIWIFIIPVVALNLCLFVSVNYMLFENTIFQVREIDKNYEIYGNKEIKILKPKGDVCYYSSQ